MNKRTILTIAIVIGSILLVGPLGLSPAFLFVGLVLATLIYNKGERTTAEFIRKGYVTVTEIRERKKSGPLVEEDEKPITGHLVEESPAPVPAQEPEPVYAEEETVDEDPEPDFVIGTTEDKRVITLEEISSLGVGGVPGSGKTVSMVGLAAQAVVKYKGNIRFLVVDPHLLTHSPQALSARMKSLEPFYLQADELPNPVYGGEDLVKWIRWMTKQARDRLGGKVPFEEQIKLVLLADEFTALMDDETISPLLTELLLLINEQARKVGMFALVASPQWKASRVNGTEVRNTIASFLCHNMPPNIARQVIPNGAAEKADTLARGQAIFKSFGTVETVRVPMMNHSDILKCIDPYIPVAPTPVLSKPEGSGPIADTDNAEPVMSRLEKDKIPEPGIAEIKSIYETYCMLNRDLDYTEDNAIKALAIHFYPGDPRGEERVRLALRLGEQHL